MSCLELGTDVVEYGVLADAGHIAEVEASSGLETSSGVATGGIGGGALPHFPQGLVLGFVQIR